MSQAPLPSQSAPSSSFPPHMDSAILSIAHSPPAGVENPGSSELSLDGTTQRKITLLTRPLQQQTSTPGTSGTSTAYPHTQPLPSSISQAMASDLQSQQQGSVVGTRLPASFLPQATPPMSQIVAGIRAARGDYFDTEDPSVNLHEFIINSLQAQKNRVILLKLEEEFLSYVSDPNRLEPLKLPPWDSYHRMLAHRVAAYFGLEHNVDPMDRTCVVVCKGPNTRIPQIRFTTFLPTSVEEVESSEPKLILKRSPRETADSDKFDTPLPAASSSSEVKSFEEREEEYEKARARIFSQQSTGGRASISFDLGTPRRGSSIFSHAMHHRRTASDTATAMLSRPSVELKEGPSSSHSSRSATPLISTLLRQSQETSPPKALAPLQPLLPLSLQLPLQTQAQQQQKHQQATESSQQAQLQQPQQQQPQTQPQQPQQQSQQQPSQPHKYSRPQQPQTQPQTQRAAATSNISSSLQFQPVQGLPVIYPQPAVVPDPNWYYNNMMLYPVSPQPYIPAQYAQVVQPPMFPLNQQYSVAAPGVIGQPSIISPPVTRAGIRLPVVTPQGTLMEPMTSPTLPSAVTLIRPVPQQASPVRVPGKTDSSLWSHPLQPQSIPLQQPVTAMPGSQHSEQTAFTIVPVTRDSTQQITEQMEQSLTIGSGANVTTDGSGPQGDGDVGVIQEPEKQGMSSVGQKTSQRFPVGLKQPQPSTLRPQTVSLHTHPNGGNGSGSSYVSTTRNPNVTNSASVYSIMPGMEPLGGQMVSPTQVRGAVQFMRTHPQMLSGGQDPQLVGNQSHLPHNHPGSLIQYPSGMPQSQGANQPTTPPVGPMNLPPQTLMPGQQHQGIFSPPSTGVTHSPIQILGHTLGTSLFSPPPSSTAPHGMFVNSPTTSGKVLNYAPGAPTLPPVGSGPRFRRYNSPNQGSHLTNSISPHSQSPGPNISQNQLPQDSPIAQHKQFAAKPATNGTAAVPGASFQPLQLPPRLAQQQQQQQQQQRNTGTRYQNQRHPANRGNSVGAKGPTLGDHMPSQFMPGPKGSPASKREPLLPTPPSTQMVKLDTTLTCGVPLNVMEVLSFPPEGSLEWQQAVHALREMGVQDFKAGRLPKTGEEVMVAVFSSPESAIKALHIKHPHFTLSIPRNNHAKFILSLLQALPTQ